MMKSKIGIWRAGVSLAAFSGLLALQAQAASFIYVASQSSAGVSSVAAYSSAGVLESTFVTPTGGFTNAFALAVDSSGNVYVSDAGGNRVIEYNSTGSTILAIANLPSDTSGGGISPQEIALDSGNLYTTNLNGNITKFTSNGAGGFTSSVIQTVAGARGILVNGTTTYIDASSATGGKVVSFTTGNSGSQTDLTPAGSAYPGGQLRGMTVDPTGNLYLADSSWDGTSGNIRVSSNGGTTWSSFGASVSAAGPNDIAIANASSGATGVNDLYVAEYFSGVVAEFQDQEVATGHRGNFVKNVVTLAAGTHITGIGFVPGVGHLANSAEPLFFTDLQTAAVPEPSSMALSFVAGLALAGMAFLRRREAQKL